MAEKCLLMTSLAILVCHPSSTIRCFKPKGNSTSPKKEKNPSSPTQKTSSNPLETKISKSRKVLVFNSCANFCDSPKLNVYTPLKLLDEIVEGQSSKTIVEAIFRSEWKCGVGYTIEKILKVNHNEKVYESFEERKKMVNSKFTRSSSKRQEERVFYHGATITCSLSVDNKCPRICSKKSCGVCGIIGQNYGNEKHNWPESLSTSSCSAHRKIIKKFGDHGVSKNAIIVSRVIASCRGENKGELDSINILNPRAILPCFVIIYSLS